MPYQASCLRSLDVICVSVFSCFQTIHPVWEHNSRRIIYWRACLFDIEETFTAESVSQATGESRDIF